MDTYIGVVYTASAETQLLALTDSDIRYQLEPSEYEEIIQRDPVGLGTLREIDGEPVYVFVTAQKKNGPPRLAITYRIFQDPKRLIQIMDIRPLMHCPVTARSEYHLSVSSA